MTVDKEKFLAEALKKHHNLDSDERKAIIKKAFESIFPIHDWSEYEKIIDEVEMVNVEDSKLFGGLPEEAYKQAAENARKFIEDNGSIPGIHTSIIEHQSCINKISDKSVNQMYPDIDLKFDGAIVGDPTINIQPINYTKVFRKNDFDVDFDELYDVDSVKHQTGFIELDSKNNAIDIDDFVAPVNVEKIKERFNKIIEEEKQLSFPLIEGFGSAKPILSSKIVEMLSKSVEKSIQRMIEENFIDNKYSEMTGTSTYPVGFISEDFAKFEPGELMMLPDIHIGSVGKINKYGLLRILGVAVDNDISMERPISDGFSIHDGISKTGKNLFDENVIVIDSLANMDCNIGKQVDSEIRRNPSLQHVYIRGIDRNSKRFVIEPYDFDGDMMNEINISKNTSSVFKRKGLENKYTGEGTEMFEGKHQGSKKQCKNSSDKKKSRKKSNKNKRRNRR